MPARRSAFMAVGILTSALLLWGMAMMALRPRKSSQGTALLTSSIPRAVAYITNELMDDQNLVES